MPRYSAEQIYGFARQAGFTPDEAATMTAVALAESGGNSRAHNPMGEDSRGLWQINARAHPGLAQRYDLYDPAQNARAAYEVSRHGDDISPWTVTHGGASARYLRYRGEAEAAAVAYGDGSGHGVWTGTRGYGNPVAAGDDGTGGTGDGSGGRGGAGSAALDRFLDAARDQVGDTYVFGAEADLDDPDPSTFDCSELTQWAAHRAGVDIPDGATAQFLYLKQRGMLIPVDEAKNTPGALLFTFGVEPRPGVGEVRGAHVAISLGGGRTVEARNSRDDVGQFTAGNRFRYAAVIPGISDGSATPLPADPPSMAGPPLTTEPAPADPPMADLPPSADPVMNPPVELGGVDTDRDGLTDAMERRTGLDPERVDTDGDNLSDSYEMVTTRSDPRQADTDGDRLNDAFELARGLDPRAPDTDGDGHLDGSFAADQVDTDTDGLDDALEQRLGLDAALVDTDADGFSDALEMRAGSDPTNARSGPMNLADDPLHPAGDLAGGGH